MVSVIRSPQVGQPFDYSAEKVARKVSEATGIKNTRHLQELVKDVIEVFYFPYVELKNKELLLPPARPVYDIVENAEKYKSEMAPKGITDADMELSENAAETYLIGVLNELKEKYKDVYEDIANYIESEEEQGEGQQGKASEKEAEEAINDVTSKIADKIGDLMKTEKKLKDIGGKLAGKRPGTHERSRLSPEQLEKMALNAKIRELLNYMEGMDVSELVKKAIRRTPYGVPEG
ncbi:MAG: hypothetical protein OWQ50_05125, partial [Acidianus infernus]|nr:hypothetical protein [Acidianus infernus]